MLPKPPPREPSLGFLYLPPYRVCGISIAGEITTIVIPELDVCFDMGSCPRAMLSVKYVALSHGHMDHVGGLAYYFSQRRFQGMGDGHVVCDARIAPAVRGMMAGYMELERQQTSYQMTALEPEQMFEIKNNIFLRPFALEHTTPTFGYAVIERRSKLRPEFAEFPQEKLRELKERGTEITYTLEIPLVAYVADTLPGAHLLREDVRKAQIIITECTFFEPEHKERARVGMHMHVDDIVEWLRVAECQAMVLTHISRRTHLGFARTHLTELAGRDLARKVHFLMDHRTNKARYEEQLFQAEREARKRGR